MNNKIVGTLTLLNPVKKELSQEVAAWHTEIEFPAGDYPVYATIKNGKAVLFSDSISAVITRNYTPSLFGGARINSDRDGSECIGDIHKQAISVQPWMLINGNGQMTVKLTEVANEWIILNSGREFNIVEDHPEVIDIKNMENVEYLKSDIKKNCSSKKYEIMEKHDFMSDENLLKASTLQSSASNIECAILSDIMTKNSTGKSYLEHGVSFEKVLEVSSTMNGYVSSFPNRVSNQISQEFGYDANTNTLSL